MHRAAPADGEPGVLAAPDDADAGE
jgi:hypothetical protein